MISHTPASCLALHFVLVAYNIAFMVTLLSSLGCLTLRGVLCLFTFSVYFF